jgi:transketolase
MRNAAIKKLVELAEKDRNIILAVGDLGYGVLNDYRAKFPEQFFNAGICEQNMTSVAAGMALEGKTVFTYSIANFPTLRCVEQIRNDAAYHDANVKVIAVGGGFAYGSLGMSHHATEDIAIMRSLPHVTVLAPGDLSEAEAALELVYRTPGTCYLRLGKGGEPRVHLSSDNLDLRYGICLMDGTKVCLLSTGGILSEVKKAAEKLNIAGISTALYSFPMVKPLDQETLYNCAQKFDLIVTVEEHNINGGFGGAVAEVLAEMPQKKAYLRRIGLHDEYSSIVGDQAYLRNCYGMSAEKITQTVRELLGEKA